MLGVCNGGVLSGAALANPRGGAMIIVGCILLIAALILLTVLFKAVESVRR
jgi:hypothetical protein